MKNKRNCCIMCTYNLFKINKLNFLFLNQFYTLNSLMLFNIYYYIDKCIIMYWIKYLIIIYSKNL